MSSSMINGAIGKSPLIDKINELTAEEMKLKTVGRMEQQVLGAGREKYPEVPISFPRCKEEAVRQVAAYREEKNHGNTTL